MKILMEILLKQFWNRIFNQDSISSKKFWNGIFLGERYSISIPFHPIGRDLSPEIPFHRIGSFSKKDKLKYFCVINHKPDMDSESHDVYFRVESTSFDDFTQLNLSQNVKVLDVVSCKFKSLEGLQHAVHLRELCLVDCGIKASAFNDKLKELTRLTKLDLNGNDEEDLPSDFWDLRRTILYTNMNHIKNYGLFGCACPFRRTPLQRTLVKKARKLAPTYELIGERWGTGIGFLANLDGETKLITANYTLERLKVSPSGNIFGIPKSKTNGKELYTFSRSDDSTQTAPFPFYLRSLISSTKWNPKIGDCLFVLDYNGTGCMHTFQERDSVDFPHLFAWNMFVLPCQEGSPVFLVDGEELYLVGVYTKCTRKGKMVTLF